MAIGREQDAGVEFFRIEVQAVAGLVSRNARILDALSRASTNGPVRRQTGIAYLVK
jgi:hypothetical protein